MEALQENENSEIKYTPLYDLKEVQRKILTIATEIYGANCVKFTTKASNDIKI